MKKHFLKTLLSAIMIVLLLSVISPAFAEDDPALTASFGEFDEESASITWNIAVNSYDRAEDRANFNNVKIKVTADPTLLKFPEGIRDYTSPISVTYTNNSETSTV